MEATEAVKTAKQYVTDLFADEGIVELGLEELDVDQGRYWKITIGFSRPWSGSIPSVLGGQTGRSYKIVRIDDVNGRILSVKDRTLANSL